MLHMGLETRFLCIFSTNSSKSRAGEILECGGYACILKGDDDDLGGLFNLFSFRHYTSHFHFIFLKYINTLYF